MTPAQLVAVDAMREAWDPETVERMLRAVDGRIETAVALAGDWLFARTTAADFVGDLADDDAISAASSMIEKVALDHLMAAHELLPGGADTAHLDHAVEAAIRETRGLPLSLAPSLTSPMEQERFEHRPESDPCFDCGEDLMRNACVCGRFLGSGAG